MAKATVLACDTCGVWDSESNPVRRVTVAGPKFELCERDRARLLVSLGIPADVAVQYQQMINDKVGKTGALPPLSAAVAALRKEPGTEVAVPESEGDLTVRTPVSAGDPNGDPDQTDLLTVLSEAPSDQPRATAPFAEGAPVRAASEVAVGRVGHRPQEPATNGDASGKLPSGKSEKVSVSPRAARPRK